MAGKTFVERRNVDAIRFDRSPTNAAVNVGDLIVVGGPNGGIVGVVQQTTKEATEEVTILTGPIICHASIDNGTVGASVIRASNGDLSIGNSGTQVGVVVEVIDASTVAFFKFERAINLT